MSIRGRVILVGAGPGAPDLITVRGERALRSADAVVYDALAPAELLDLAPPHAERINVGKRGHDAPTRSQDDVNALLVRLAREGKRVVRLKGGDPFVFGRGGEEASACRAAGVAFEVVPGVSAAIGALAYAGIPVTDRRHAASFAVVTGHKDPTRVRQEIRWDALAAGVDTLVVLMGMRNLDEIVARLMAGGRSGTTPAAVVMLGTTPHQRVVEAPLRELPKRVAEAGLGAPAALVVGDVVRLRRQLAFFEAQPLFGRRVLVTRRREQAGAWVRALAEVGAEAVVVPMIRIEPLRDTPESDAALGALADYDLLLLTSANAARELAARAAESGRSLAALRARVLCVGPATSEAAREAGLAPEVSPGERFDASELLERLRAEGGLQGRRVLLPGAARGRPLLAEGLRESGARVDVVALYRTLRGDFDAEALRAQVVQGAFDALTFASPSAARHFAEALGPEGLVAARRAAVVAIGRVTAEALAGLGLEADRVAARAEAQALVDALAEALEAASGRGSP